jgi:MATE family multidrug resistance protein
VPVVVSNVSTPLIGVVDTAVVGQIPDAAYIGAAAIGGLIFTFVFWGFGFLRMGTTGLTAQALGSGDVAEVATVLCRSLLIALAAGILLIVLQWPIRESAFAAVHASARVEGLADGTSAASRWAHSWLKCAPLRSVSRLRCVTCAPWADIGARAEYSCRLS